MINPHPAVPPELDSGGNFAGRESVTELRDNFFPLYLPRRTVAMINITELTRLPMIRVGRRPNLSIKVMQRACAIKARIELIAWYFRVSSADMPICSKMLTEKYWIAETPVIWIEAWIAQARKRRRKADLRNSRLDSVSFIASQVILYMMALTY